MNQKHSLAQTFPKIVVRFTGKPNGNRSIWCKCAVHHNYRSLEVANICKKDWAKGSLVRVIRPISCSSLKNNSKKSAFKIISEMLKTLISCKIFFDSF